MNKWLAAALALGVVATLTLQHLRSRGPRAADRQAAMALPPLEPWLELPTGQVHSLINGVDLSGWRHVGGGGVHVNDGLIWLVNDDQRRPGYLVSERAAKNFRARFRCVVFTGDTGLFYRCRIDPRTPSTIVGPQVQVNVLPDGGLGGVYETQGRGWLSKPSAEVVARLLRPGDAITCEVEVRGDRVRVTTNGQVTADFREDATSPFGASGFFALQIHGGTACRVAWQTLDVEAFE